MDLKLRDDYFIPELELDAFEKNGRSTDWFKPIDISEVRRLDYISLLSMTDNEVVDFLSDIMDRGYCVDLFNHGLGYKDCIFNRFYFKEFVLREKLRGNPDKIKYWHFKISDYGDKHKKFDDRILAISAYTSHGDNNVEFQASWQILASHVSLIFTDILTNNKENNWLNENIPIFTLITVTNEDGKLQEYKYIKFEEFIDKYSNNLNSNYIDSWFEYFSQAITRFAALNYYMLNKVEEEQEVSMNDFKTSGTMVECIKSKAYLDKKIRINLDRDYDIKLNIKPNRKNIYSHDNKIIRRLCDYKFQVCAHWHSYWYGPRNKPELRHKERRWVEAYYKNEDKEFNIIKERYKEKGE